MSEEMHSMISTTDINSDGTKNTSITLEATASSEPYTCVASDIPGIPGHQQDFSVFVLAQTYESPTEETVNVTQTMSIRESSNSKLSK